MHCHFKSTYAPVELARMSASDADVPAVQVLNSDSPTVAALGGDLPVPETPEAKIAALRRSNKRLREANAAADKAISEVLRVHGIVSKTDDDYIKELRTRLERAEAENRETNDMMRYVSHLMKKRKIVPVPWDEFGCERQSDDD
jgi:hypothetical protein